jgi:hypothetical protein
MHRGLALAIAVAALAYTPAASAQVLGACGTKDALKPAAAATAPAPASPAGRLSRVPLPGEQAPNFELAAVVGKTIKKIKLSDYDGKWRIVCFYPADFTFV